MNNEGWWKDKDRGKPKHSERNLTIPNPHSVVQSWHLTGRDTARSYTDNSDTTQARRTRNSGVPSKGKIFLLSKTLWRDLASTQPPIHGVPEVFSWKQLERKAEHSSPRTAKLQKLGATLPLCNFLSRRGHRDKFVFSFGVLYRARKSCMATISVCLFVCLFMRYYQCVKRVSVFVNSGTGVLYKKLWNMLDFGESRLSDFYTVLKGKITFCTYFPCS